MYRVLLPRFVSCHRPGDFPEWHRVAEWIDLGPAQDMEDAKARYGGAPILESKPPRVQLTTRGAINS